MIGELLILYCKLLCNSIKKIAWKAALGVPPQWFNRNRALALGIVASGSAIGGLVLPFVITRINSSLNVEWWVCLHNHPRYLRITNSKCVKKGLIECWASLSLLQTSSHAFLSRKSSRDTRRARNLCRCVKYSTLLCSKIQTILCGSLAPALHSWVSSFHFSSCQVRLGDDHLVSNYSNLLILLSSFFAAYITYSGLSASDSSAIIAVLSAANFIGRIIIG